MKSIFETQNIKEITSRLLAITPETPPVWGKMSAAQMMRHCQKPLELPLGLTTVKKPPLLMKLLVVFFKSSLYNDKPWKKNLPTAKEFIITDTADFKKEREVLLERINAFANKGVTHSWPVHPVFGSFTGQQWGQMQYKHLDHHCKQFGQ